MIKIMFSGHRDAQTDEIHLENLAALYGESIWLHGGAAGFDAQVQAFAAAHGISTEIHLPEYSKFPSKSAPLIRNKEMLAACDVVVACYDGRQHGGTFFVVTQARKLGKKLIILPVHRHKSTPKV